MATQEHSGLSWQTTQHRNALSRKVDQRKTLLQMISLLEELSPLAVITKPRPTLLTAKDKGLSPKPRALHAHGNTNALMTVRSWQKLSRRADLCVMFPCGKSFPVYFGKFVLPDTKENHSRALCTLVYCLKT
jgi:hypothetical protein